MSVELLHLCGTSFVLSITLGLLSKKAVGEEGPMLVDGLGKLIELTCVLREKVFLNVKLAVNISVSWC